ncbi:MAG: HAD family hydrolase, partial [Thermoguttaceae bacterium]
MTFEFTRKHDYLVGVDSDGCAFDTMELKHKECFIPNIINYWELQGVSKYAREAAEFVNLYSKSRGINRFPALIEVLEWLQKRTEVKARGVEISIPQPLRDWIKRETKLGNPALEK